MTPLARHEEWLEERRLRIAHDQTGRYARQQPDDGTRQARRARTMMMQEQCPQGQSQLPLRAGACLREQPCRCRCGSSRIGEERAFPDTVLLA